ncbi:Zinc/iron permease [Phytophthora cactorum]|nr:Zinc/iron permease [Phytophthora cactorum]
MAEETCCGCVTLDEAEEYDMGLHIGSIFIIFVVSAAGTMVPIISQKIPQCKANSVIMEAVMLSPTGLFSPRGIEKLSNECLGSIVEDYESLGLAFVLITLVLMHFIECESSITAQEAAITPAERETPKPAENPENNSKIRRKIATIIFEAGVVFHSVIIGLDLDHRWLGLGTQLPWSKSKLFIVNFVFAITTPIGQVIGIGIRTTYSDSSGILNCVAGGILLYTGLFLSRPTPQRFSLYICLWLGAGLMALIGKWA